MIQDPLLPGCRFLVLSPHLFAVAANVSHPSWLLPLPPPGPSSQRTKMSLSVMFMPLIAWKCLPCPHTTVSRSCWAAVFSTHIYSSTTFFFFNIAFNN
jgi:hypothetical protein